MGDRSQDSTSLAKESYGHKRMQSEGPLPGRYNQEQSTGLRNMNLANNLSLAADVPAVRGTDSKVQKRSNSTYNQTNTGHYNMPSYYEANALNKINTKFGLSNKFEYGHDPNGGSKSAAVSRIVLKAGSRSTSQCVVDNKQKFQKRDQTCNFSVQPVAVKLQNSETKKIGENLDSFVKNQIDEDFLKKSHVPFANVR